MTQQVRQVLKMLFPWQPSLVFRPSCPAVTLIEDVMYMRLVLRLYRRSVYLYEASELGNVRRGPPGLVSGLYWQPVLTLSASDYDVSCSAGALGTQVQLRVTKLLDEKSRVRSNVVDVMVQLPMFMARHRGACPVMQLPLYTVQCRPSCTGLACLSSQHTGHHILSLLLHCLQGLA